MSAPSWIPGVVLHLNHTSGHSVADIIASALEVANRIGCMTTIDVNGIRVLSAPGDAADTLVSSWMLARDTGVSWASSTQPQRGSQN